MTIEAPFFAEVASAPKGARPLWLRTSDGLRIRVVVWGGGRRGTVFIFPGRTEYAEKYGLVAQTLTERGFSILVIDWRGQGLSDRRGKTPMEGHVEGFREYQADARAALKAAAELGLPGPAYLFGHSMGGCIALRTLAERGSFAGAVLSAPMWRLQFRTAAREMQSKTIRLFNRFGAHQPVSPVSSTEPDEASPVFEDNPLTSDAGMFAWSRTQVAAHPELALGPPAASWMKAAVLEMLRLDFCPLPALPVLALAGSEERIVSNAKIRSRAARLPQGGYVELAGARHELFLEAASVQERMWCGIDSFLAAIECGQSA